MASASTLGAVPRALERCLEYLREAMRWPSPSPTGMAWSTAALPTIETELAKRDVGLIVLSKGWAIPVLAVVWGAALHASHRAKASDQPAGASAQARAI